MEAPEKVPEDDIDVKILFAVAKLTEERDDALRLNSVYREVLGKFYRSCRQTSSAPDECDYVIPNVMMEEVKGALDSTSETAIGWHQFGCAEKWACCEKAAKVCECPCHDQRCHDALKAKHESEIKRSDECVFCHKPQHPGVICWEHKQAEA